jgi:hypothetical protein
MFVLKPDATTEITFKIDPFDTELPTNPHYDLIREATNQASDKSKTEKELLNYVSHEEVQVRAALANNPKMSSASLKLLSKDENKWVRDAIICNHNVSAFLLEEMFAAPENQQLFKAFAKNHVSAKILKTLSKNEDQTVKVNVAKNSYTPVDVLEDLAENEHDILVVFYVLDNKNLTSFGIEKILDRYKEFNHQEKAFYNLLQKVVLHPNLTDELVKTIISLTTDLRVLATLCRNSSLSENSFRELAKNPALTRELMSIYHTPIDILEGFDKEDYNDMPSSIIRSLAIRKDLSSTVINYILFSDSAMTVAFGVQRFYDHPLVSISDLVKVAANQSVNMKFLTDELLNPEKRFNELCDYVLQEYNLDVKEWPKNLIAETLGWEM